MEAVVKWKEELSDVKLDRAAATYDTNSGDMHLPYKFTDGFATFEANRTGPVEYDGIFKINRELVKMILNLHGLAGRPSVELSEESERMIEAFDITMQEDYGIKIANKNVLYELFPKTLSAILPSIETMIQAKSIGIQYYFDYPFSKTKKSKTPKGYAEILLDENGRIENVNVGPYIFSQGDIKEPIFGSLLRDEARKWSERKQFVCEYFHRGKMKIIGKSNKIPPMKIVESTSASVLDDLICESGKKPDSNIEITVGERLGTLSTEYFIDGFTLVPSIHPSNDILL